MTAPLTTDAAPVGPREVERAATALDGAPAEEVVRWALDVYGDDLCVTSSMRDAVLIHLVSRVRAGVPVVFLDTGYHFAETVGTRDAVAATYPVRLVNVRPRLSLAEQDAAYGADLYARDPDRCCALRKVAPLEQALAPYAAWLTGLRRDESPARADTPVVAWDARRGKVKVNPLATWTEDDHAAYAAEHGVLVNPLVAEGYPSIGCAPCTRRVAPGEDPRAGRWAGFAKDECGLHT